MTADNEHDELDGLLARLESVPPADDFVARVMARAREGEIARWPLWQRAGFAVLYITALVGLAVLAFLLGGQLEQSQTGELIQLALLDLAAVKDSPGVYLTAFSEAIPWAHLLALLVDAAVLGVATRLLLSTAARRSGLSGHAVAGG